MERDFVVQAQRGDREAFAILARTRGDTLFGVALRILCDVGLAEDAVQQMLVIAWRELPRLRDPDRFDAWLQRTFPRVVFERDADDAIVHCKSEAEARTAAQKLDQAAAGRVIHPNTASRLKSRLSRRLKAAKHAAPSA